MTRAHVKRALDFFNRTDVYFCIGKTSAWTTETQPPSPDPSTADVSEIIGFKKVETSYMVVPDNVSGTIQYRDSKWRIVTGESNVYSQGAKWVYLEAYIRYDELPLGYYRQVGLYSGLVKNAGVLSTKYNLLPAEVQSRGILEVLDNRQPSNRQADQKERITMVIEF